MQIVQINLITRVDDKLYAPAPNIKHSLVCDNLSCGRPRQIENGEKRPAVTTINVVQH